MLFVIAPPPDRAAVERLSDLPKTNRGNSPLGAVEIETSRLPIESQKLDQPAALAFEVPNQSFIVDLMCSGSSFSQWAAKR
jgi:hypothetical protein